MSNTKILVTALLTYLLVCIIGGGAYYYYVMSAPPGPPPDVIEAQKTSPAKELKEEPKEETPEDKAAKEAQAAEAQAQAQAKAEARKKSQEDQAKRERERSILTASMERHKNGSVTIYSYYKPERPASGLYLHPSMVEGSRTRLQYELYYYYNINDGQGAAWVFGDHFLIKAGGKHYDFPLNPDKRQKALAPDAEWLSERYTGIADSAWLEALRAVAAAGYGTMTYYQEGGKSITAEFTGDAYRQVKDMVTLYDLTYEQNKVQAEE